MIRWVVVTMAVCSGVAFAAGIYVGWKTTLRVCDSVERKKVASAS
jgi:hypothetical protein